MGPYPPRLEVFEALAIVNPREMCRRRHQTIIVRIRFPDNQGDCRLVLESVPCEYL